MLAQVLDWLGDAPAPPGSAAGPVGWPLAEVGDPFALEVHRPVEPDVPQPGLPVLPVYVPREHDAALARGGDGGGRRDERDRGAGGRVVDRQDAGVLAGAGAAARPGAGVAAVASDRPAAERWPSCPVSGRGRWCG